MVTLEYLRVEEKTAVLESAVKRAARSVRVFGSVARGDNRAQWRTDEQRCCRGGRSPKPGCWSTEATGL